MSILIPIYLIQLVIVFAAIIIRERSFDSGELMFPTKRSVLLNLIPGFYLFNMIYKLFRELLINIKNLPDK